MTAGPAKMASGLAMEIRWLRSLIMLAGELRELIVAIKSDWMFLVKVRGVGIVFLVAISK
jgi:hypothetical protein